MDRDNSDRIATPDFRSYPARPGLVAAEAAESWVRLRWADAVEARFHYLLLRDNAADELSIDAQEARAMGLVTEVVSADELDAATLNRARMIAAMPNEMQRIHKHYVNHVYDLMGRSSAAEWYNNPMTMMSFCPTEVYRKFSEITLEKGLKTALAETNAGYHGLD